MEEAFGMTPSCRQSLLTTGNRQPITGTMTTAREFIADWQRTFARVGIEDSRLNVELLLAHAMGVSRGDLMGRMDDAMTPTFQERVETLCRRRVAHEPVDYILGVREFFSREFHIEPGVLIPRPETELIIEEAKKLLPADARGWAADVGCGSGALAVTLALEFPNLHVIATDLYPTPLRVTGGNALRYGVSSRVHRVRMDALSAIKAAPMFDMVVSNPPYVTPEDYENLQPEVHDFEPKEALVGGEGGVAVPARVLVAISARLKPGAFVLMEHGMTQGAQLVEAATRAGLQDARTVKDYAGLDRVLVARA
jgi:release factor glutamine methyltransferase